jgi:hypothetical protein
MRVVGSASQVYDRGEISTSAVDPRVAGIVRFIALSGVILRHPTFNSPGPQLNHGKHSEHELPE